MRRRPVALLFTLGVIGGVGLGGCDHGKGKSPASRAPSSDFTPGTATVTVPATTTSRSEDFTPGTATLTIPRTTTAP